MADQQEYYKSLKDLHNKLEPSQTEIEKIPEDLSHIRDQITHILDNPGDTPFSRHRALIEHLEDAIEQFEIEHPTLTDAINRVINTLNNIGI